MAESGAALAERIHKLQTSLVRELNDQHIFVHQAIPVLREARRQYARSEDGTKRKYFVPAHSKQGIAKRTDAQLKEIYNSFLDRDLFATSLIAAVSRCEGFIFDVLRCVLREHPRRLQTSVKGNSGDLAVPLAVVLDAEELNEVIEMMITRRLNAASYATPVDYLGYFQAVTGIPTTDGAFNAYIEIKATRDLLVHNAGIVNDVYVEKAGKSKRGKLGKPIPINSAYYDSSIVCLKYLANLVNDGGWAVFYRRERLV